MGLPAALADQFPGIEAAEGLSGAKGADAGGQIAVRPIGRYRPLRLMPGDGFAKPLRDRLRRDGPPGGKLSFAFCEGFGPAGRREE